jgi:hypothetical protein
LYLKAYLAPAFWYSYLGAKYAEAFAPPPASGPPDVYYTPVANDMRLMGKERELGANEAAYFTARANLFADARQRVETVDAPVIGPDALVYLHEIQAIVRRNQTDFRIVISPLYQQARLNPADLKILTDLFGVENVNDFSGANEFTNEVHNYYEPSHYRPSVGREIIKRIYTRTPVRHGMTDPARN